MSMISLQKPKPVVKEDPREACRTFRRLLLPFGGADFFFVVGEKPLFLLDLTLPAENEMGVNFDIRLAYAMLTLARDGGADEVCFAVKTEEGFDFNTVLERSGYAQLAALDGVRFIDLRQTDLLPRQTDTALLLEQADLYRPFLEADVVISLVKLKSAEDCLLGSPLLNVRAMTDWGDNLTREQEVRALVDVYSVLPPDLTIVDGLRGEGGFQPYPEDFLLAATDAVSAEATVCAISGIAMESVEHLQLAVQYGLGIGEPSDIRLYGDDMADIML